MPIFYLKSLVETQGFFLLVESRLFAPDAKTTPFGLHKFLSGRSAKRAFSSRSDSIYGAISVTSFNPYRVAPTPPAATGLTPGAIHVESLWDSMRATARRAMAKTATEYANNTQPIANRPSQQPTINKLLLPGKKRHNQ